MIVPDLTSSEFLKGLKQLELVSKHDFAGQKIGQRLTRRKGASVEFKDFREYHPGDDIRFIDWNLWGRLDKFYIKLFHNEENLNVHFLLDVSDSMFFGSPSKWTFALKFLAAASYLSLHQKDTVRIYPICEKLFTNAPTGNGPGSYAKIIKFVEQLHGSGRANLIKSVDQFVQYERRKGIVFFISDFLIDETELDYCLRKLAYHRHDVSVLQILSPEEENPNIFGSTILQDSESRQEMELEIGEEYYLVYQEALENHKLMLHGLSKKYGFEYSYVCSDHDYHQFITSLLRKRLSLG